MVVTETAEGAAMNDFFSWLEPFDGGNAQLAAR